MNVRGGNAHEESSDGDNDLHDEQTAQGEV